MLHEDVHAQSIGDVSYGVIDLVTEYSIYDLNSVVIYNFHGNWCHSNSSHDINGIYDNEYALNTTAIGLRIELLDINENIVGYSDVISSSNHMYRFYGRSIK